MDSELEFADPKEEIEMLARAFETAQNDEGKLSAESAPRGVQAWKSTYNANSVRSILLSCYSAKGSVLRYNNVNLGTRS